MKYVVMEYTEWDAETTPYGPYDSIDEAWKAAQRHSQTLASRKPGSTIRCDEREHELLVYDAEYEESEPTDDEYHVRLWVTSIHKLV